jgi:hypothetical protein
VLLCRTGSSGIALSFHAAVTLGSPATPNCAMKPGTTRKKREPSKNPAATNAWK